MANLDKIVRLDSYTHKSRTISSCIHITIVTAVGLVSIVFLKLDDVVVFVSSCFIGFLNKHGNSPIQRSFNSVMLTTNTKLTNGNSPSRMKEIELMVSVTGLK